MTKPPRRATPPNWSRKLARVIMLDDGRQLRTLDDARDPPLAPMPPRLRRPVRGMLRHETQRAPPVRYSGLRAIRVRCGRHHLVRPGATTP